MVELFLMSLKLEIRLYTLARLAWTHDLVLMQFLRSSDWLMHSELGYFAHSLISGLNDGAATLSSLVSENLLFLFLLVFGMWIYLFFYFIILQKYLIYSFLLTSLGWVCKWSTEPAHSPMGARVDLCPAGILCPALPQGTMAETGWYLPSQSHQGKQQGLSLA